MDKCPFDNCLRLSRVNEKQFAKEVLGLEASKCQKSNTVGALVQAGNQSCCSPLFQNSEESDFSEGNLRIIIGKSEVFRRKLNMLFVTQTGSGILCQCLYNCD